MADDARITITLDAATAKRLVEAAAEAGISPEKLAAEAVAERVAEQLSPVEDDLFDLPPGMLPSTSEEIARAVEEGREDFRQGRWVTHEEAMAQLQEVIDEARRIKSNEQASTVVKPRAQGIARPCWLHRQ